MAPNDLQAVGAEIPDTSTTKEETELPAQFEKVLSLREASRLRQSNCSNLNPGGSMRRGYRKACSEGW
jgi:hypothetical protein